MSNFSGLYDIRDGAEQDRNFILATFLRGMYYGDSVFSLMPKDLFMANYKKVAEGLLASPKVIVKVACLKEDSNVILGYSILSNDFQVIHFCFVKSVWRNKGIAKSLTPQYPTAVTHLTKLGKQLLSKYPNTVFNPFAL